MTSKELRLFAILSIKASSKSLEFTNIKPIFAAIVMLFRCIRTTETAIYKCQQHLKNLNNLKVKLSLKISIELH